MATTPHDAAPERFAGYPDLLKSAEVAEILRLSPQTVRRFMASGEIPGAFKIGPVWYVAKAAFSRFVEGGAHAEG